jgi:hypothetical protein
MGPTVDQQRQAAERSPKSSLMATPVGKISPHVWEKMEKTTGNLTRRSEASGGRKWNMAAVLGVGWLEARISEVR